MQEMFTYLAYLVGGGIAYLATIGALCGIYALMHRFKVAWAITGTHLWIGLSGWCILHGIGGVIYGRDNDGRPELVIGVMIWLAMSYIVHKRVELSEAELTMHETESERQRVLLKYIPKSFVARASECAEYLVADELATSVAQHYRYLKHMAEKT